MPKIFFNDTMIMLEEKISLELFLLQQKSIDNSFAITINRKFIPKMYYKTHFLEENDHVEIITPMQGG